jgi:hypothetical protein
MSAALGLVGLVAGVGAVLFVVCRHHLASKGMAELRVHLDALHRQVVAWQAAHDHQVELLDRRMRDVEVAAAGAQEEARIVSVQLAELTQGLVRRLELVEQRNDLVDRFPGEGRIAT